MLTASRLSALLIAFAALFFGPRAFATSCAAPELRTSTERAHVIFVGVVAAETRMSGGMGIYRVEVDRVFKGSMPATVTVLGGGMKGSSFHVGERYLVFGRLPEPAAPPPPDLFAHLCGGTQPTAGALEWLATLGAGDPPTGAGTSVVAGPPSDPPGAPAAPPPAPNGNAAATDPAGRAQDPMATPPPDNASATAPAASTPPTSGGCAGCTSARSDPGFSAHLPLALLALAIPRLARRRRAS